jgi:hypothetical protein
MPPSSRRLTALAPLFYLCFLVALVALHGHALGHTDTDLQPQHILVIPTPVSTSESLDAVSLVAELARRGHACTILALNDTVPFWHSAMARVNPGGSTTCRFLPYSDPHAAAGGVRAVLMGKLTAGDPSAGISNGHIPTLLRRMHRFSLAHCQAMMNSGALPSALEQLQAMDPPITTVLGTIPQDMCACIVAQALDVPVIAISGSPLVQLPVSTPQLASGYTPHRLATSWRAKLHNTWLWAQYKALPLLRPAAAWRRLAQQLGCKEAPTCEALLTVRMLSSELEYPVPVPAGEVFVSSISPRPAAAIKDAEVARFMDEAGPGGVLLVAFGSTMVYGQQLAAGDYQALAAAFNELGTAGGIVPASNSHDSSSTDSPQPAEGVRVLWGIRDNSLPGNMTLGDLSLGPHVKAVNWFDQNDVLGHPHTRAFVSAGGLHSVYEAGFHGVPLVALPFTAEQLHNAKKAEAHGFAYISRESVVFAPHMKQHCNRHANSSSTACLTYTTDGVLAAVRQVLNDSRYRQSALVVSRVMQARYRLRPPLQLAADEVELALMKQQLLQDTPGGMAAT